MNQIEDFDALVTILGALLLYTFWIKLWHPHSLDKLRQDLFDLRDSFFDRVAEGRSAFSFECPGYVRTRQDLNEMIRFARQFGLLQIVVTSILTSRSRKEMEAKADGRLNVLTEAQRSEIDELRKKQGAILLGYLARTSPLFWLFALTMVAIALVYWFVSAIARQAQSVVTGFDLLVTRPIMENVGYQANQQLLIGSRRPRSFGFRRLA